MKLPSSSSLALGFGLLLFSSTPSQSSHNSGGRTAEDDLRQLRSRVGILDVLIIGAGAAGLSAAYTLNREENKNYLIVEASHEVGGRAKTDTAFTNGLYPLDLGPSFIQFPDDIVRILGREDVTATPSNAIPIFVNGFTYQRFLKDFITPWEVLTGDKIRYGCRVTSITSATSGPVLTVCADGRTFAANHVIVTVPLSILQDTTGGGIKFTPSLPTELTTGHPGIMWGGYKILFELTKDLTDEYFCLGECYSDTGESFFWEFSSISQRLGNGNVLMAGYIVGDPRMHPEFDLDEAAIAQHTLKLLDDKFDNQASRFYVRHYVENWSKNPNIRGTWSSAGYDQDGAQNVNSLNKLWIAGEAFPISGDERGRVDAGAFSGHDAALKVLDVMGVTTSDQKKDAFWKSVASDLGRGK